MNVAFCFNNGTGTEAQRIFDQLLKIDRVNCIVDDDCNWLEWHNINPKRLHCVVEIVRKIIEEFGMLYYDYLQLLDADGLNIDEHYTNYLKQHRIALTITHIIGYQEK